MLLNSVFVSEENLFSHPILNSMQGPFEFVKQKGFCWYVPRIVFIQGRDSGHA